MKANNFARGHYTIGKEIVDLVLDRTCVCVTSASGCCDIGKFFSVRSSTFKREVHRVSLVAERYVCMARNAKASICVVARNDRIQTMRATGSASWPTTAPGQPIVPAFGITCEPTLQRGPCKQPCRLVAEIQAPGCRASASTMPLGQKDGRCSHLRSTSCEPSIAS